MAQTLRRVLRPARPLWHCSALEVGLARLGQQRGHSDAPVAARQRGLQHRRVALLCPVPPGRAAPRGGCARQARGRDPQGRPAHRRGQGERGHLDVPQPVPHAHQHGRPPGRFRPERSELGLPHVQLGGDEQGRVRVVAREDVAPRAVLLRDANRPRPGILPHLGAPGAHARGADGAVPSLGAHSAPRARAEGLVVRGPFVRAARDVVDSSGNFRRSRRRGGRSVHGGDRARRAPTRRPRDQHVQVQGRVQHGGGFAGLGRV